MKILVTNVGILVIGRFAQVGKKIEIPKEDESGKLEPISIYVYSRTPDFRFRLEDRKLPHFAQCGLVLLTKIILSSLMIHPITNLFNENNR